MIWTAACRLQDVTCKATESAHRLGQINNKVVVSLSILSPSNVHDDGVNFQYKTKHEIVY